MERFSVQKRAPHGSEAGIRCASELIMSLAEQGRRWRMRVQARKGLLGDVREMCAEPLITWRQQTAKALITRRQRGKLPLSRGR
ncbi:hypothetical protein AAFF_G00331170 [Aldrovandia affinis]|uniref:Uncharacterized protein n=1 Tax=Aldrovandia affinis TaxID=143900 RepID=A0AAD7R6S5_9TELE|nr:hypothetical protein AAFF_G00331170 [Aldrovandia affinis]